MEFTHSLTAFYCSLCDIFMKSKEEAEAHGETKVHVSKYKEYLSSNPMYETSYVKDKMAAYAKYSVDKERSRERASTLEDTNQEAFFCEVKKKIGVNLSSQNSISFEEDTSNDDTFNNSEGIAGDCKEADDYICDEEISKIDNEDNERKEIAGELGHVNNIDDDTKNDDDWGEVLEETLIDDENMNKDHLDVEENCVKGMEEETQNKAVKEDKSVEEIVSAKIEEKEGVDIEVKGNQDLVAKDDQSSVKKEGEHNMERRDNIDIKEYIHQDIEEQKGVIDDEKDNFHCRLSKVPGEKENGCDDREKNESTNNLEMKIKEEMKNDIHEKDVNEDLKVEKCVEDLSVSEKNADKVEKRKAKNDRKEEKRTRKREKKEDQEEGDETSIITSSKKNVNTSSIRVSSRSLSSSNMQQQNESKKGSSRESRKSHSSKRSDDFGYYKEKRLSVEEEEKIKALKERIKKKESVENEEASDDELDSNEVDKPKKKLSNVMIGKMPFLKRSKCSGSSNKKNINKADLHGGQLSVSAAEERIRKIVSEGIKSNSLQNSDENKLEVDSKSLTLSLHPNVEYITEIQSSGDESMFVKTVSPAVQMEDIKISSEAKIPQKMDHDQIELNNLINKEAICQQDDIKGFSRVQQNFSSKTFDEIPVPQTNCKTMQKSEDLNSTYVNMNLSLSNQQKPNSCSNAASKKESFIPELKPPPLPFISVQSNVVSSNQHIVLPDLRKPPPNIIQHNLTTPNQQRSLMQNNFSTPSNQQIMQHNQTSNQHMMPHNLPAPPSNYHMMGPNLPVPPPSQHMMGPNLLTQPPGQHMLSHNIAAPQSGQHLMGHNLSAPPPNQHIMGHNLTVPPPNQNYSPLHQQGRRMDFSMSPQNPSMMGPSNSNFSISSPNPSMVGPQNSNYSMSPQISPTIGPLNSNFSMVSQNPLMVGSSSSNFTRSQNSPMMGQFRSNSEFSMSPHNPVSLQQNNSMMDQNYNTRSNPKLLGSTLPLPPTPPEIGTNITNYVESPLVLKPPPPPFNFSSLTPPPKILSNDNESGRIPPADKFPTNSASGTKATNESTIAKINNQNETMTITPSMEKCLDNFFETILDDLPAKTVDKNVTIKTVKVKSSKKGANLNSKMKVPIKTSGHDSLEKASNKAIAIKDKASNKDISLKAKSEAVTRMTRSVRNALKTNAENVQKDGYNEKTESLEERDTLVQEGLELLEFAEETVTSPKPSFNWDSSQDSI